MAHFAQFRVGILLTAFLLSFTVLHADEAKGLQKHLQDRFSKKVWMIRNFYGGNHLTFDSNGTLIHGDKTIGYKGCWCATQLQVNKVEIKKDMLILRGPRIVGIYDGKKKEFSKLSRAGEGENVEIDIELDAVPQDDQVITGILEKVFITRTDELDNLIPDAWRADDFDPAANEVARVKKDSASEKLTVSAPKPIHTPDPEYPEEARREKISGDVLLSIVIDKQGRVVRIRVDQCAGRGLDERAVQAVSQWTFEPAMRNGEPVTVQVEVDVTFHIYQ